MLSYDPFRWFWISSEGVVFDSQRQLKTDDQDEAFAAFVAAGGVPTPWPLDEVGAQTDAALQDVLAPYGLSVTAPTLDEVKSKLKAAVDAAAEAERLKYITPGEGQAMTYQRKVEEAKRAVLEDEPSTGSFPFLAASLGIDGNSIKAVAATVLAMDAQWAVIGAGIEAARLSAKTSIEAATTSAEAEAVFNALIWPAP